MLRTSSSSSCEAVSKQAKNPNNLVTSLTSIPFEVIERHLIPLLCLKDYILFCRGGTCKHFFIPSDLWIKSSCTDVTAMWERAWTKFSTVIIFEIFQVHGHRIDFDPSFYTHCETLSGHSQEFRHLTLSRACERGHAGLVSMLLADSRVDPTQGENEAIMEACKADGGGGGYVDENQRCDVLRLLLQDSRIEASLGSSLKPLELAW